MEICSGYRIITNGSFGKARIEKIEDMGDLVSKPHCINVSIQKILTAKRNEIYVSLISILPIGRDEILDKDNTKFDYTYDNFLLENQVAIERLIPDGIEALETALIDLIKESERIMLLYSDKVIKKMGHPV